MGVASSSVDDPPLLVASSSASSILLLVGLFLLGDVLLVIIAEDHKATIHQDPEGLMVQLDVEPPCDLLVLAYVR